MESRNVRDLLAVYGVIQAVKEAVQRFEDGEINVFEALDFIRDAAALARAA